VVPPSAELQPFARDTRLVNPPRSVAATFIGTSVSAPSSWPSTYERAEGEIFGPFAFACVPRPLPFTTTRLSPNAASAVGYQSVGMRPARRALRYGVAFPASFCVNSNTATELLSASATNNRDSSGERSSALGVLPSAGPSGAASLSSATTRCARVSTTNTLSVLEEATKSRLPAALRSSAEACLPAAIFPDATSLPELSRRNAETKLSPHAET
jgi:hypothetical protein